MSTLPAHSSIGSTGKVVEGVAMSTLPAHGSIGSTGKAVGVLSCPPCLLTAT